MDYKKALQELKKALENGKTVVIRKNEKNDKYYLQELKNIQ